MLVNVKAYILPGMLLSKISEEIVIPSILIERLRKRGLDPVDVIPDVLMRIVNLDPDA